MIGQTITNYTILSKLGEGGMGVVYKARDTKLDRDVALKFLPAHLTSSANDRARFVQEAKAAAALSHPNVLSVIDIVETHVLPPGGGDPEDRVFIVMEFVDGQTLRERKETLSFKQAVEVATQVADGLAAAHEKGIVHRDVKPENVMVRKDGIAQIMDFGLAKLRGNVTRLTREGSTVGTAGYMSPEQVQGLEVDHRSDIFSLGVLMYELFSGRTPFKAAHETALMYEIVNVNPEPMSAAKPDIDPELDRIVLGCLEKDPNDRTQSAKQVSIDLKRFRRESGRQQVSRITSARPAISAPSGAGVVPAGKAGAGAGGGFGERTAGAKGMSVPWIVSAILLLALASMAYLYYRESSIPRPTYAASLLPPSGHEYILLDGGHVAVSPDGTMLTFVDRDSSGKSMLWVRDLSQMTPRQIPETEGASYPFWSPDSRYIGYFSNGKMKKVLASGGPTFVICDAPSGRGGSWNTDDVIVFAPNFDRTGIDRVNAGGGAVTHVTRMDTSRNMSNARWPQFLPDGKHFLYTTQAANRSSDFAGALYVASLDGTLDKHLIDVSSNTEYRDGKVLYVRQEALVAQPFDTGTLEFTGDVVGVVDKVGYAPNRSKGVFSTSFTGVLVYQGVTGQRLNLSWLDRSLNDIVPVGSGTIDNGAYLSHDGTKIAFDDYDPASKNIDIWIWDIARSLKTRITFDATDDNDPILSPDGSTVAFTSWKEGVTINLLNASGSGGPKTVRKLITSGGTTDWSPDGRYIVYMDVDKTANFDLWYTRADGSGDAVPFLKTAFTEEWPRISPDGRWLAYDSDESGRPQVYVKPFPAGEGKWQVSITGGYRPIWARDGKSVFYANDEGIAETVVDASGPAFVVGASKLLFRHPAGANLRPHGVTKDGMRILVSHVPIGQGLTPLTLLTDWRRASAGR